MTEYNYSVFVKDHGIPLFEGFCNTLHVGERAPDFPLEDLDTGETVAMKDLWRREMVIIEFGSFT